MEKIKNAMTKRLYRSISKFKLFLFAQQTTVKFRSKLFR